MLEPNIILPRHIAIIMDGNGRWAKNRGLVRTEGHKRGAEVFRKICRYCADVGIEYLTFYAFSTENWKRSAEEVGAIMNLLREFLEELQSRKAENEFEKTAIRFLGTREGMAPDIVHLMALVEANAAPEPKIHINVAVNYGGRDEIVRAVRSLMEAGVAPQDVTEQALSDALYTAGQPDPDLIIRPSGEYRLSNFLIWQAAYAEFYFDDILWPDFTPDDLDRAINAYAHRNRRFGGTE